MSNNVPNLINSSKLPDLVKEIDANCLLHPSVEELLRTIADDFIDNVAKFSCKLAKHRRSTILEAKDVQFCLEKNWGISVPGMSSAISTSSSQQGVRGSSSALTATSNVITPALFTKPKAEKGSIHVNRLQHIRKVMQKHDERKSKRLKKTHTTQSSSSTGKFSKSSNVAAPSNTFSTGKKAGSGSSKNSTGSSSGSKTARKK